MDHGWGDGSGRKGSWTTGSAVLGQLTRMGSPTRGPSEDPHAAFLRTFPMSFMKGRANSQATEEPWENNIEERSRLTTGASVVLAIVTAILNSSSSSLIVLISVFT
jgi:hypothetical protein